MIANPFLNPLVPEGRNIYRIAVKFRLLKKEGIMEKISYECRDYESVDDKSLS